MIDITRETVAYLIMGMAALVGLPLLFLRLRRRRREKLRRRGIKRYGH
jgi:LPXTG-motif cell wall-anchored protein